MNVWREAYAEDLQKGDVFLFDDESLPHLNIVSTPVTEYLDAWVTFATHTLFPWGEKPMGPSVVEANVVVHVLNTHS